MFVLVLSGAKSSNTHQFRNTNCKLGEPFVLKHSGSETFIGIKLSSSPQLCNTPHNTVGGLFLMWKHVGLYSTVLELRKLLGHAVLLVALAILSELGLPHRLVLIQWRDYTSALEGRWSFRGGSRQLLAHHTCLYIPCWGNFSRARKAIWSLFEVWQIPF